MAQAGTVYANGIDICFETIGDPRDDALLLVMGLGSQLNSWDTELCRDFANRGYYVIRYDNRDVGLSSHFRGHTSDIPAVRAGDYSTLAYRLEDMAADGIGLLDALGIDRAHVLGISMGGMIAQLMAIQYPSRVLSLCSIMSSTGSKQVGQPTLAGRAALATQGVATTEPEVIESAVERAKALAGGGFPFDEAMIRRRAERMYDRAHDPAGVTRQQMAALSAEDRTDQLSQLSLPTVVIHGSADPVIAPSGGAATAAAVPGSRLVMIPGMGHELPRQTWERVVNAFATNARRANAFRVTSP